MSSAHSEYHGTEHRGNVITSMHGIPAEEHTPVYAFTDAWGDVTEAQKRRGGKPEAQHIGDDMPYHAHRPQAAHAVYADGKRVKVIPQVKAWDSERHEMRDYGLAAANALARNLKRIGRADVTVDAWCPGNALTSAYDTLPETNALPTIYREALNDVIRYHASIGHISDEAAEAALADQW